MSNDNEINERMHHIRAGEPSSGCEVHFDFRKDCRWCRKRSGKPRIQPKTKKLDHESRPRNNMR